MKPSLAIPPSRSSVTGSLTPPGEAALHEDDSDPLTQQTPNAANAVKSPRSVHFFAPGKDGEEQKESRYSNALSPSASFMSTDHDGGDMLSHITTPPQRLEPIPPFGLTRDDVEAAFEFLDVNGSGLLTMANLKQRLSAFYPQMTSKEYKFLVEDPSGNNGGGGQVGNAEQSTSTQAFPPLVGADKVKSDSAHSHNAGASPPPPKTLANESFGACNNAGGGGGHAETPLSPAELATEHNTPSSRPYGSRAGLDVDQLWDLIQSFQQLQRNLGGGGGTTDWMHRQTSGGGSRRHVGSNGLGASYDATAAASLFHGHGGSSGGIESGFDAVAEAFRVYDPRNTHYVDKEVLSRIMAQIGFGELSEKDLALLVGTADFDGDGRICLDDFRRLVSMKGRFKKA
ncbi:hypothetical protein ABB37_03287 [Leptomonas pyrrhocoris]|uniref:EF-hand domain-containing protein n=1 Tax=Leptomonas pyrrhocoris TaxID=157538 RepID=A0A0N0DWS1_LEPPY|nr:hypothetical protein ABB37_03287 [Leptomonas pyrrhocoris]KPA82155.1 hypothetical protein ABB37_03287 [Leptomonas pyrrhocoris]|eukprot:XP_015660594.1 hypothetical protein ABB37_03287 [Leptomonas pyrrhocoris]